MRSFLRKPRLILDESVTINIRRPDAHHADSLKMLTLECVCVGILLTIWILDI